VQAYAALCFSLIVAGLISFLPFRRQNGDLAGLFLIATGLVTYITEIWRDPLGRGAVFNGFLKGPQVAAIILVLGGAALLLDCPSQRIVSAPHTAAEPGPPDTTEKAHG